MGRLGGPVLRGKTGCLCCRRRRKKCDEGKPSCNACRRNFLICVWPGCAYTTVTATSSSAPDNNGTDRARWSSATKDDTGGCGQHAGAEAVDMALLQLSPGDGIDDPILTSLPPDSRILLEHYYHRTADVMSPLPKASNPYVTQLLPISCSNDLILQTLLVLSGVHYEEDVSRACQAATWAHYGRLMKSLKTELTRHVTCAESTVVPLLIATMMLSFIENARLDSQNAMNTHLKASRQLLLTALELPGSVLDDVTRGFLIETYAYTIILSDLSISARHNNMHMLGHAVILLRSTRALSESITYGFPIDLFQLIPEVSVLVKSCERELELSGAISKDTTSAISKLRGTIRSWKSHSTSSNTIITAKIYQQALLLYLDCADSTDAQIYDTMSDLEYAASIQKAFEILGLLLECLPTSAPISTILCWPLAIFGSAAISPAHQAIIRERFIHLHKTSGLRHVKETLRMLELLWSCNEGTRQSPRHLSRKMEENNRCICFF
ncbi:hypothetical protein H2204_005971 [Knufia peltigerae]|uniref:Zn(2)-C6 fungal-type domain-containing protein n=1 Tax=Knufia peltigerae TaxID=1002370 RepID=A0AA39CYB6_9EURO|nr:hypothetical protein H2204_005971 [Knufia peltigerae]